MSNPIRVYGRRFCATCEHQKPLEDGVVKDAKINRWVCGDCLQDARTKREDKKNVQKQEAA